MHRLSVTSRIRDFLTLLVVLMLLFVNGCAPKRPSTVPSPPAQPEQPGQPMPPGQYQPVTGPAKALYLEAEKALQAGNLGRSEMFLERALRIEPQNGQYWHSLAQVRYRQSRYKEAVQFCLKAESLAGGDRPLVVRNRDLLVQAQKAAAQ